MEEITTILIDRKTGEITVSGPNPCAFCKYDKDCDHSQLKPCFIPCG